MPDSLADGTPRLPSLAPTARSVAADRTQVLPTSSGRVDTTLPPLLDRHDEVVTEQLVPRAATGPVAVVEPDRRGRRHHTMLPRTICVAAMLIVLAAPAWMLVLNHAGHLTVTDDGTWVYDSTTRRVMLVGVGGALSSYAIGWLWWSVAAATNASRGSKWSMSPWTPLLAFAVAVAAVAVLPGLAEGQKEGVRIAIFSGMGLVLAIAHFGILAAFRRTASAVGAQPGYWTRLIVIPWATAAIDGVGAFFNTATDRSMVLAFLVVTVAMFGWYALTMYQAMISFDRACTGTRVIGQDDHALARFLKQYV